MNANNTKGVLHETGEAGLSSQPKMQRFLRWLEDNGALLSGIGVRLVEGRRIAFATRPMHAGELVLYLPRSLLITAAVAATSPIGTWFRERKVELTASGHLAVFLLWTERKGGFFHPYVDVLPRDVSNMPMHFSEAELAWLEGTSVLQYIRAEIELVSAEYRELASHFPPDFSFTAEEYAWAKSMVRSRAFMAFSGSDESKALVPLADMMDHAPQSNVDWGGESRLGFICTARAGVIAGGAELTDNYGPSKGNGKLFCMYGFTLEDNDDTELYFPKRIVARTGPPSPDDMQFFNPAAAYSHPRTRAMFAHLRRLFGAPDDCGVDMPVDRGSELAVLETLRQVCLERIKEFRPLPAIAPAELPPRLRDALRVREGELRVLNYLLALAENGIALLSGKRAAEGFEDYAEALAPLLSTQTASAGAGYAWTADQSSRAPELLTTCS